MEAIERPTFESGAGKRIYEYVERHGTATRQVLLNRVSLSFDEFQDHLDRLKSEGYLEEEGGVLRITLDVGVVKESLADHGWNTEAIRRNLYTIVGEPAG